MTPDSTGQNHGVEVLVVDEQKKSRTFEPQLLADQLSATNCLKHRETIFII